MTEREKAALGRVVAVIPALDPDPGLPEQVAGLLERGIAGAVVVDDGSGPDSAGIFAALEAMDGCTLLRHGENRGKGRALKTAFAYIRRCPAWTGVAVVTADADGQHRAEDVCAVALAAARSPGSLALGVRDLGLAGVPVRSRVGNRVTSWAFHLLYGLRLEDTQTGLRGIPWGLLDWCGEIPGDRFEYEMRMLVRAARDQVPLVRQPIDTVYFRNNAGTHLRPWRDSWRVFLALLSGLGQYTAVSALSAVADVLTFWLCTALVFRPLAGPAAYWWSALTARVLSSAINYTLNRRYVFGADPSRRTVVRYYCLWLGLLVSSYLLLLALTALLPGASPVVCKAGADLLLGLAGYQVQLRWVFREEASHG